MYRAEHAAALRLVGSRPLFEQRVIHTEMIPEEEAASLVPAAP